MLIENIRQDFPILNTLNRSKPLVYLDNGATTQKPLAVINAISEYYAEHNANIHRGIYELSERATMLFEETRKTIKDFINAEHNSEIIFVRGATEAINLVASSFAEHNFKENDEIIISVMEHHSNIIPWQLLNARFGTKLRVIPISDSGELDLDAYQKLFSNKTKMVAVAHASNVLGTINPIKTMAAIAHQHNIPILVDGASAFPHMPVDVKDLDCDFYVFSSHKAYGPTGIGALYGKLKFLEAMPPYQGGGDMVLEVSFSKTTFKNLPHKFEAGTPNIAGVIGFNAALNYLKKIGMDNVLQHEKALLKSATKKLLALPGIRIIGNANDKVGIISFLLKDIHPHDVGTILDHQGIAIRAGHHCAMPLMERYQIPATVRASMGIYTNENDIDALVNGLEHAVRIFANV